MAFCQRCGAALDDTAAFCSRCGERRADSAAQTPPGYGPSPGPYGAPPPQPPGYAPPYGQQLPSYCRTCGNQVSPLATVCMTCGAALTPAVWRSGPIQAKSKTAAVLLAVFLSFWTWLYTFRADATKFWIGLGVGLGCFFLRAATLSSAGSALLLLPPLGIWIWAVVDAAVRPTEFYRDYYRITQ